MSNTLEIALPLQFRDNNMYKAALTRGCDLHAHDTIGCSLHAHDTRRCDNYRSGQHGTALQGSPPLTGGGGDTVDSLSDCIKNATKGV